MFFFLTSEVYSSWAVQIAKYSENISAYKLQVNYQLDFFESLLYVFYK